METLNLNIKYFNKEKFIEYYDKWVSNRSVSLSIQQTSPFNLYWNHFFERKTKYCEIIDKFEYVSKNTNYLTSNNNHRIFILENDFLWYPSFEDITEQGGGSFLYSISSLKEASDTYKMYGSKEDKFGENWFLNDVYKILQRDVKLNELLKSI